MPQTSLIQPNDQVAIIKDIKAPGVSGGTISSGSWQARDLNFVENFQQWLSLSASQFTLTAGIYDIEATVTAYAVGRHKARIYNVTDAAEALVGDSMSSGSTDITASHTIVRGVIAISSSKTFELQHQVQTSGSGGQESNFSVSEIYSMVKIRKIVETTQGIAAASGGIITTVGDYRIHTFTSSGTFDVSYASQASAQLLLVAGGGGGGQGGLGGGGGGGGGVLSSFVSLSAGSYSVIVGSGGAPDTNGSNSSALGLTAIGGGAGGASANGNNGGCGGGGSGTSGYGGSGTPGQGKAGGNTYLGSNNAGGGGGGAFTPGTNGTLSGIYYGGNGGNGAGNNITGSWVTYGGGGGGGYYTGASGTVGSGGLGGGGNGGVAGTDGLGGGGGGMNYGGASAKRGGNGIVIIRYKFQ